MKFYLLTFFFLFSNAALAEHCSKCDCAKKDSQEELARACESKLNDVSSRVDCLASARLVATVDFCSRQYATNRDRVICIKKVDQTEVSTTTK